jgi:hypothetical protein
LDTIQKISDFLELSSPFFVEKRKAEKRETEGWDRQKKGKGRKSYKKRTG